MGMSLLTRGMLTAHFDQHRRDDPGLDAPLRVAVKESEFARILAPIADIPESHLGDSQISRKLDRLAAMCRDAHSAQIDGDGSARAELMDVVNGLVDCAKDAQDGVVHVYWDAPGEKNDLGKLEDLTHVIREDALYHEGRGHEAEADELMDLAEILETAPTPAPHNTAA